MRRAQSDLNSQAIRNLAYNPSFEAAGISTILRTNLAVNPSLETAGAATVTRTNIFTNPSAETASGTVNVRTNLATNPSFEASSGTVNVRTNLVSNPSFETASGTTNVRTNLVTNPSMETASGTVNVRTNLATNPSFETANGTVNVRTNYSLNPSLEVDTTDWFGNSATISRVTTEFHTGVAGLSVVTNGTSGSGAYKDAKTITDSGWAVGDTCSASVWVKAPVGTTMASSLVCLGGATNSPLVTWTANGAWEKIAMINGVVPSGATSVPYVFVRVNAAHTALTFYADELLIEKSSTPGNYFDGITPAHENLVKALTATAQSLTTITTGISYSGSTWSRAATPAGTGSSINRMNISLADLTSGEAYTTSVTLANDQAFSQQVNLDWCDLAIATFTLAPGEVRRVQTTATKSVYDSVYRFSDLSVTQSSTEGRSILFKDWNIERGTTDGTYFTGLGDFTYAWSGTANASISNQIGTGLSGVGPANQAAVYRTGAAGAREAKILFNGITIVDSGLSFSGILTVAASKTYTVSVDLTSNIARTVKFSAQGTGTVNQNSANISLSAGVKSRQSWSFTTTSTAPTSVALYILRADTVLGTLNVDNLLIEEGTFTGSYFHGSSTASGDFSFAWSGVVDASVSYQRAPGVASVFNNNAGSAAYQSATYPLYGGKSVAALSLGIAGYNGLKSTANVTANLSYTFSAWVYMPALYGLGLKAVANGAGLTANAEGALVTTVGAWSRVSLTFTPLTTGVVNIYVVTGSSDIAPAGQVFYTDGWLLEQSSALGAYFDGATPITNLVGNPSMTTDIAGWVGKGGTLPTIARDATRGWTGSSSLKFTGTTVTGAQGVGYNVSGLVVGQQYTMSGYVYVPAGSPNVISTVSNIGYGTETGALRDQWVRLVMTFTATATTHQPGFDTNGNSQIGTVYYVDGVQLEKGVAASTYLEGQGDFTYAWTGTANASTSYQQAPGLAAWSGIGRLYQSKAELVQGTYSGAVATNGVNGDGIWPATNIAISANTAYTFSAWVKATSAHALTAAFRWADSVGASAGADTAVLVTSQLVVGSWVRISASATSPSTAATLQMLLRVYETHTPTVFYMDGAMVSTSPDTAYFDGSTPAAGDFTYAWSGTANASSSYQQAPGVAATSINGGSGIQSVGWSSSSGKSIRHIPNGSVVDTFVTVSGVTLQTGATYTISATCYLVAAQIGTLDARARSIRVYHSGTSANSSTAQNVPGSTRLSVTFTVTDGAAYQSIRLYNGASVGNGDVWWDDLLIEESPGLGSYFDGANPIQNLFPNPSVTTDTTGYGSAGGTIATLSRDTTTYYQGPASLKVSWTATGTGLVETAISGVNSAPASAGKTYTSSAYMKLSSGATRDVSLYMNFFTSTGTYISQVSGSVISATLNSWVRPFVTALAPANTSYISVGYRFGSVTATDIFHVDSLLVEESSTVRPFYEGTGDYTYIWSGTANASTSYQQAPGIVGVTMAPSLSMAYQSKTVGVTSGTKSIRITPTSSSNGDSFADLSSMLGSYVFKANTAYTISGNRTILAPQTNINGTTHFRANIGSAEITFTLVASVANVAGTQRVVGRFTTGATAALNFIRVYNGSYHGGGDVWWDDIVLEEGITTGIYFDGANPIQNLVANPSFEVNTTGWTQYLSTISRDTAEAHVGSASLKVVTTGQGGPSLSPQIAVTANIAYTQSAWVKAPSGQAMTMQMLQYSPAVVNLKSTSVAFTGTGAWQRISLTDTITLGATLMTPYIFSGASGVTFWVDAVLVERSAVLNPYYEGLGDFTYAWTGTANASSSEQRGFLVNDRQNVTANSVVYHSSVRSVSGTKAGAARTRADVLTAGTLVYPLVEYSTSSGVTRLTASVSHTWSLSVWVPSGSGTVRLEEAVSGAIGTPNTLFDQWDRISVTFVAPAAGSTLLRLRANTTVPAGTVIWWDNELLEVTNAVQEYFDGATPTSIDYTYTWAGTANNSASYKNATAVSNVGGGNATPHQSTEWSVSGKSLRIYPFNVSGSNATSVSITTDPLIPGRTYTAIATRRLSAPLTGTLNGSYGGRMALVQPPGLATLASDALPNVAGVGTLRWTFKVDPAAVGHTFRLGHGGVAGSGDVWWDNVMIVEGTYTGDYIDGTKPLSKWDGTADASVSVGYPPQLFDLAGKPDVDLIGATQNSANPVTVDGFTARTFYVVYESSAYTQSYQSCFSYGVAGSKGFLLQTAAANSASLANRIDFPGGTANGAIVMGSGRLPRRHVTAFSFEQGLAASQSCLNGSPDITSTWTPSTTGWDNGRAVTASSSELTPIRALVFYGHHDRTTRIAISRYLGNKYGAYVA